MKVLFLHIPRTGGTFLSSNLAINFGYDKIFSVDRANITIDHFKEYDSNIIANYDCVVGHIPFALVEKFASQFDLILSCVRSPLPRLFSHYFYQSDENGNLSDDFHQFVDFFRSNYSFAVESRNEQCGYIGRINRFQSALQTLADYPNFRILRTERIIADAAAVFAEFGLVLSYREPLNASVGDADKLFRAMRPDVYEEIFKWLDDDYLLYEYISSIRY
jgi:hypothetical protein